MTYREYDPTSSKQMEERKRADTEWRDAYSLPKGKRNHHSNILDLITYHHFLFPNTQDNFSSSKFTVGVFTLEPFSKVHAFLDTWASVSSLHCQKKSRHFSISLRKIQQRFPNGAIQSYFHVYCKLLCSVSVSLVLDLKCLTVLPSQTWFTFALNRTPPPQLTKMSSLTWRDGITHDPSLQGAQISTIWQRGLNGGWLSGQGGGMDYWGNKMRCKLKGKMAHRAGACSCWKQPDLILSTWLLGKRCSCGSISCSALLALTSHYAFACKGQDKLTSPHQMETCAHACRQRRRATL